MTRSKNGGYVGIILTEKRMWLGRWPTARQAAVAVDRAVLYFGLDRPLNEPRESRELGPASPEELRRMARLASTRRRTRNFYVGVRWIDHLRRWEAYAKPGGHRTSVGLFLDEHEAAMARERFLLSQPVSNCRLNFPKGSFEPADLAELRGAERRRRAARHERGFEGVGRSPGRPWAALARPWMATLHRAGLHLFLGSWRTREEAARAHDRAVLHYFGPDNFLNFPEESKRLGAADAPTLCMEARKQRKATTSSRFVGACWSTVRRSWIAKIMVRGVTYYAGGFDEEEKAARARDRLALDLLGKRAPLNFHPVTRKPLYGKRLCDLEEPMPRTRVRRR